jgi:hypothetical protein
MYRLSKLENFPPLTSVLSRDLNIDVVTAVIIFYYYKLIVKVCIQIHILDGMRMRCKKSEQILSGFICFKVIFFFTFTGHNLSVVNEPILFPLQITKDINWLVSVKLYFAFAEHQI